MQPDLGQKRTEVARPADGHRGRGEQVFENQVPADEPGHALAHRRVAVRVRGAGDRDHAREFRVAEAGEQAAKTSQHERDRDGGTRIVRGGVSGQHENAGPDDRADAEQREIHRTERALEAVGLVARLSLERGDALSGPESHEACTSGGR